MPNPITIEPVFEDLPDAPPRPPSRGRSPEKWEEHLSPFAIDENVDKPARLWTYPNKAAAVSRAALVRKRLVEATPEHNWEFKVRPVPGSPSGEWGVYVIWHGAHTEESRAEAEAARAARQVAIEKARATKAAQKGQAEAEPAQAATPETAKSAAAAKVANARKGK